MSQLKADVLIGETILLDGDGVARITLLEKSGQRARLMIEAGRNVLIELPRRTQESPGKTGLYLDPVK